VKEMSEVLKIAITDQNVKTPKHCKVFSDINKFQNKTYVRIGFGILFVT
jgi:hypothetical protein